MLDAIIKAIEEAAFALISKHDTSAKLVSEAAAHAAQQFMQMMQLLVDDQFDRIAAETAAITSAMTPVPPLEVDIEQVDEINAAPVTPVVRDEPVHDESAPVHDEKEGSEPAS